MTELEMAKQFTERMVTFELEMMAARETYSQMVKDLTIEMKGKLTPTQIKGVKLAAKRQVEPLEKAEVT